MIHDDRRQPSNHKNDEGNNIDSFLPALLHSLRGQSKKFCMKDQNRMSYLMIPFPHKTQRAKFIMISQMSFFGRAGTFWKLAFFLKNFLPGISSRKSKSKRNLCLSVSHLASISLEAFQCAMKSSNTFECCIYSMWGTGSVKSIQSHSCWTDLRHCCS